jgi:hypothetical protein
MGQAFCEKTGFLPQMFPIKYKTLKPVADAQRAPQVLVCLATY